MSGCEILTVICGENEDLVNCVSNPEKYTATAKCTEKLILNTKEVKELKWNQSHRRSCPGLSILTESQGCNLFFRRTHLYLVQ